MTNPGGVQPYGDQGRRRGSWWRGLGDGERTAVIGGVFTVAAAIIGSLITISSASGSSGDSGSSTDLPSVPAAVTSSAQPTSSASSGGPAAVSGRPEAPSTAPAAVRYSVSGVSRYSPEYYAVISSASVSGNLVTVNFEAFGRSDLREPSSSCLEVSGNIIPAKDENLAVDDEGHYKGQLYFDLMGPGTYSFRYSCMSDYSSVPLFTLP
jgi:hypothetical protein